MVTSAHLIHKPIDCYHFSFLSMPVLLPDSMFVVTTNQRYQKIAKNDMLYVQAEKLGGHSYG
jgi:hypothetical protein